MSGTFTTIRTVGGLLPSDLLVRFRFHLTLPVGGGGGVRPLVAEDARLLAFEGSPANATWLDDDAATALLTATPGANLPADAAHNAAERIIDGLDAVVPHLDETADRLAAELLESHRKVRAGAGAARRGLSVTAQKPADILGVYVYLPIAGVGAGSATSGSTGGAA